MLYTIIYITTLFLGEKQIKKLFSKEKVNLGRQTELDIAKGLAIIFMVIVHVNEVYQSEEFSGGLYERFIEFIGSPPAAPIFMLLLGVGLVYSKNSNAHSLIKRGMIIFISAYILNFVRDYIPYSILAFLEDDPSYKIEAWDSLWGIDILQFSGLSFIFFGLIKKFNIKDKFLMIIWAFLLTLNIFLRGTSTDSELLNSILGLLWGTTDYSWFPFLTWISFPITGYFFGKLLIRCNDKIVFYKNSFLISLTALVPFLAFAYINDIQFGAFGELYQETYYHHDIVGNIILISFAILWISIIFFLTKFIPNNIVKAFTKWSKNTNLIYYTHWIILGYSMLFLNIEEYGPVIILLLSIILFILSDMITTFISNKKKRKNK